MRMGISKSAVGFTLLCSSVALGQAGGGDAWKSAAKAARETVRTIDQHLLEGREPVSAELFTELEGRIQALEAANRADGVAFLRLQARKYRIESAWRGAPEATAELLAKELESTVVTSGTVSGKDKPQTFTFKAKPGKCYAVMGRLRAVSSDEDQVKWTYLDAGKDNSVLQRYRVEWGRTSYQSWEKQFPEVEGACALAAVDVTVMAKLEYVGSANGMRYVVVEHDRDKLPTALQTFITPYTSDSCDAKGWEELWTNPLPGSVLYDSGGYPIIPYSLSRSDFYTTSWAVSNREVREQWQWLKGKPPAMVKFDKSITTKGCPRDPVSAHSPDGIKLAKCWGALDVKFAAKWKGANRKQAAANDHYTKRDANRASAAVQEAYNAAADGTCEVLEDAVFKKFTAAFEKVVEHYQTKPYASPWDRASALKSLAAGEREVMSAY